MDLQIGDIVIYKSSREYRRFMILNSSEPNFYGTSYHILDLETGKETTFMFYPADKLYIQKVG